MKKNLRYEIAKATYSMGKLNKKVIAIQKAYKEVKQILNPK